MVKDITLPESYYVLEKDVDATMKQEKILESDLPPLVNDTNNMFDDIYDEYGGKNATNSNDTENNLDLVDEQGPVSYYQTQNSQEAVANMNAIKARLDEELAKQDTYNGEKAVTELQMKANRFHFLTFFIIFVVLIVYTLRVFTSDKTNTVETLILIVTALIVLYYLVKYIDDYLRSRP